MSEPAGLSSGTGRPEAGSAGAPRAGVGTRYLIDTSVWARMPSSSVVAERIADIHRDHAICVTTAQVLEHGFSARTPSDLDRVHLAMSAFPLLPMSTRTHEIALDVQRRLWHSGRLRAAGAFDTLIAAVGIEHDATVLHYDRDYTHIAAVVAEFREELVAPLGTL